MQKNKTKKRERRMNHIFQENVLVEEYNRFQ
jgi:hypothetical protein